MSDFRLARLLRLREREEREAKLRWAAAARAVQSAADRRAEGRVALDRAYDDLASEHEARTVDEGRAAHATLSAHATLDALVGRKVEQEAALQQARESAAAARIPYDEKRRDVEALKRLEERWRRERRRKRRRREERQRQEHISRTGATNR